MAMTVLNNTAAMMTLGELNKNISRVGKDLRKISTGDKLNTYANGPSDRAISEKMRVKLRGLEQCDRNTQTGSSMIKVASGAVSEQLEILKKMREIALKSSDDTYTDVDRDVLQKETKQLLQQVDDIAQETNYNDQPLLNGISKVKTTVPMTTYEGVYMKKVTGYNPVAIARPNTSIEIANSVNTTPSTASFYYPSIANYVPGDTPVAKINGLSFNLDFNGLNGKTLPSALTGQGISFVCPGCPQFISVAFDTSKPIGDATLEAGNVDDSSSNSKPLIYTVGVRDVKKPEDLGRAIYEGMMRLNGTDYGGAKVSARHKIAIEKHGDQYVFVADERDRMGVYNGLLGEFLYEDVATEDTVEVIKDVEMDALVPYQDFRIQDDTKASMYTNLRFPNTTSKVLFPPSDSPFAIDPTEKDYPNPWTQDYLNLSDKDIEYYDEKYNCGGDLEKIRREKWRDEFWKYPRKGAMQSENCVRTKEGAKKFIADIDNAINYILDTSTTLGSYSMRMTISNENIVTKHENTTASESVIRDADMAKEMTSYAKNNVLMQASQSMLSQANQTASSVLSLLQ